MTNDDPARRKLPIELSSVVISLETLTRELTRKLTQEQTQQFVAELCDRVREIAGDKRRPDQPFVDRTHERVHSSIVACMQPVFGCIGRVFA